MTDFIIRERHEAVDDRSPSTFPARPRNRSAASRDGPRCEIHCERGDESAGPSLSSGTSKYGARSQGLGETNRASTAALSQEGKQGKKREERARLTGRRRRARIRHGIYLSVAERTHLANAVDVVEGRAAGRGRMENTSDGRWKPSMDASGRGGAR